MARGGCCCCCCHVVEVEWIEPGDHVFDNDKLEQCVKEDIMVRMSRKDDDGGMSQEEDKRRRCVGVDCEMEWEEGASEEGASEGFM
jgi:hypothetical protein